jgi:modification methylase
MNNIHPAPFPVALIHRIISSTLAQLVLDPFSGSGTTAIAATLLGRNYIGIELSYEYCKLSEQRLGKNRTKPELAKEGLFCLETE